MFFSGQWGTVTQVREVSCQIPGAATGTTKSTPPASGPPGPEPAAVVADRAGAGSKDTPPASTPPKPSLGVPIAVELGWAMAVLFGRLPDHSGSSLQLPSEHELSKAERQELETDRVHALEERLKQYLTPESVAMIESVEASTPPTRPELQTANFAILKALACSDRQLELAYQLGRSLRDTANPPVDKGPLNKEQAENAAKKKGSRRRGSQGEAVTGAGGKTPRVDVDVECRLGA